MSHRANLVEQFRAATPSQRLDLHAAMVRDFGTGFANTLRDLVESVERAQAHVRAARAAAAERKVVPFRPRVAAA